jgi:hypothetical protein
VHVLIVVESQRLLSRVFPTMSFDRHHTAACGIVLHPTVAEKILSTTIDDDRITRKEEEPPFVIRRHSLLADYKDSHDACFETRLPTTYLLAPITVDYIQNPLWELGPLGPLSSQLEVLGSTAVVVERKPFSWVKDHHRMCGLPIGELCKHYERTAESPENQFVVRRLR